MSEHQDFDLPEQSLHNLEAERSVLGAVLIDNGQCIDTVRDMLEPGQLYIPVHRTIYKTMLSMAEAGEPIDLVTVTSALQEKGHLDKIGGVAYLTGLADAVPTAANASYYAELVAEQARKRDMLAATKEFQEGILQGGAAVEDLQARHEERIRSIGGGAGRKQGMKPIHDVLTTAFENIETRFSQRQLHGAVQIVSGLPTGYTDLDKMTGGLKEQQLIIIAARPAVGKTAFALNVAQNIAVRQRQTVAIFSLEMSADQLVERMICAESNVDASNLRDGNLDEEDWPKLTMAVGKLAEAPIFIDDAPSVTVHDIRAKCRRLQQEHGLGLIMVDYLQLIQGTGRAGNRQQEVSEISRMLKLIARELNVPVIALSQLSRSVESRSDKRPMLSDLRESGSIEQDADIVSFLYRQDYYDPNTEKKNIVEFIIGKQRGGATGTVELVFLKNFNKFVNLERAPGA